MQKFFDVLAKAVDTMPGHDPIEIRGNSPHTLGDRHLIIVQHHDEIPLLLPGTVEGLKGHARCQSAIPDDRHHLEILSAQVSGFGHTKGSRNGGSTVPCPEGVIDTLLPFGKAADPPFLPQGLKSFLPAGNQLMGIGLVPDIPDELVPGRIKDIVQGQRQLHDPQARGQVTPCLRAHGDDLLPDLLGQTWEIPSLQSPQIGGRIDALEDTLHLRSLLRHLLHPQSAQRVVLSSFHFHP